MAWNEPGKGNGKDPWGNNNQGSDGPPDLDEVFRKVKGKVGGIFGGKGGDNSGGESSGGGKGIIAGILVIVALFAAIDSFYIIEEGQRGVVLRFGERVDTMSPGLNMTWPRPIVFVERVNISQLRSVEDQATMLTKDENIVSLDFAVQYKVSDPYNFLFSVKRPELTLQQVAESAIRQVVGDNEMDYLLRDGRVEIALSSKELMQDVLDSYKTGLNVVTFNLKDVRPPNAVKAAFDDAIKAREDETRYKNEAEAYANGEVPVARGRAARIRAEAEGYRESVVAFAEGEADRFKLLLEEYAKAPEVTRQRLYVDAMQAILSNASKVMLDVDGGNNLTYLPIDKIIGNRSPRSGTERVSPDSGQSPTGYSEQNTDSSSYTGRSSNRGSGRGSR